ncbi:MAG: alkaline phosphatase family protein [Bacteroidota bacterium]|nr:alkaline phosphatase family protein [Bacteroidota bacterium]MDP4250491.1 alkaline phosphatase family protein [Bacteroidota bacterium]
MIKKWLTVLLFIPLFFTHQGFGQSETTILSRPKLIVGIVVDQMRWDYLYRYYNRYGDGGFKRMLNQGFSCENTLINYLPSNTAVGHACIFTGSVPSINGITGNNWTDLLTGAQVYCTEDSTVQSVGASTAEGKMSPRNLLVSTVTDELRVATNFQSRVVGISLKDRAAILPAGHTANAAFWLDDASGNFISSTYYMNQLPDWAEKYNRDKNIGWLISDGWTTLYPIGTYAESDADNQPYEGKLNGELMPVFPHDVKAAYAKDHASVRSTPFGNTLTLDFARAALDGYQLGRGPSTDFLTINCASTDYVGHLFGPNSIEAEDTYLRLDKDLASFFSYLDSKIGKDQYLVFLTADHGSGNAVGYMRTHRIPADFFSSKTIVDTLNKQILEKFGIEKGILSAENYQINFDNDRIAAAKADIREVKALVVDFLKKQPGVNYAVDLDQLQNAVIPEPIKTMVTNGYNYKRSGQVEVVFAPGWLESYVQTGATHGSWNPYDTHVPLVFMGWNIHPGSSNTTVHMTDIAPTIAALLHIQMPNGCIGTPITDVLKK